MSDRRVFLAICAISFFWAIGTVLFIQFPPLAKNKLLASKEVASLSRDLLGRHRHRFGGGQCTAQGTVSARWSPISVIGIGVFLILFEQVCANWPAHGGPEQLMDVATFVVQPLAVALLSPCWELQSAAACSSCRSMPS